MLYADQDQVETAHDYFQQALNLARQIGSRQSECLHLSNLGAAYNRMKLNDQAMTHYQDSLALGRQIGYRQGEALAQWNLARLFASIGDGAKACKLAEAALLIFTQIKDPKAATVVQWLAEWRSEKPTH